MDPLGTADKAHRGESVTPVIIGGLRGGDHLRIVRQPQIVIRAHVEHAFCGGGINPRPLRRGDYALVFIGSRRADLVQRCLNDLIGNLLHARSSVQSKTTLPLCPLFMTANASSNSVK
ncbi:hypothetical protein SDC9_201703 [bioreactor metagenome]|uniref:Uncharacterized protein n=1 Tax=bioreactor metagenome TaxID=1076179 RepID=A0A645J0J9_9ZZZZ